MQQIDDARFDRRTALLTGAVSALGAISAGALGSGALRAATESATAAATTGAGARAEPSLRQDPALVREVVGASHARFERVRELVEARPALAKAAWDWGFGDWETAIDAAAHTGRREIALYLLSRGARPTLFSAAMLGQLQTVRAIVEADPDAVRTLGPHSLTLLHHARAGGELARPVLDYLTALGGADQAPPNEPLAAADKQALTGVYRTGGARPLELVIAEDRGLLTVKVGDAFPHRLFHRGGREFQPAGAEAARLTFVGEPTAATLTIADGEVVRANRAAGAAAASR